MSKHSRHKRRNGAGAGGANYEEDMMLVSAGEPTAQPVAQEEEQAATTLASAWRGHQSRVHPSAMYDHTDHADEDNHANHETTTETAGDAKPAAPADPEATSKWGGLKGGFVPKVNGLNQGSKAVVATAKSEPKKGNPAVVGLTGFAMTTFLLQLHNLGVCNIGPVLALGIMYGGGAQLIAGFQEFQCGNNFGYSAFVSYGAFWISFGIILFLNEAGIYTSNEVDIACYLLLWGVYTGLMFIVSWRIHTMMSVTFMTLMLGFFGLSIAHFVHAPWLTILSACDLILCACCAWYMMMAALFEQVYGGPVLPLGRPWIPDEVALRLRGEKDVTVQQLFRKIAALSATHRA